MAQFLTDDFLLDTEYARKLYHDYAADKQIAGDYQFKNLYDIWLKGAHTALEPIPLGVYCCSQFGHGQRGKPERTRST